MTTQVNYPSNAFPFHEEEHHDPGSMKLFGFWIYLMTDCILFASAFATYGVLYNAVDGGVSAKEIFELPYVLVETFALLISSITYGFSMISAHSNKRSATLFWLAVTFICGAVFIGMEVNEFAHLIAEGNGPQRSAFLTGFFSLVGMHGLHVTCGLIWMAILMINVAKTGVADSRVRTRLGMLSLFWHFLDIVWICVFTVVYLLGAM